MTLHWSNSTSRPTDHSVRRIPDAHTDQLTSAAAVQARTDGLQRIDQMALSIDGQRVWGVKTAPGRTDHLFDLRTSMPTSDAMCIHRPDSSFGREQCDHHNGLCTTPVTSDTSSE